MEVTHKRTMSWLGVAAIGLGGANLNLYIMSPVIASQGTIAIPLFAGAFLLTIFSMFGYLELVLMYPNKVGGISVACEEAFRPYNPILTNIVGIGYWFAWLMAAPFAAVYLSTVVQQVFAPGISVNLLSTFLIVAIALLNLRGMASVQRFAIPIAAIAACLALLTVLIPVLTGHVNWEQATQFSLITPYPGAFGQITSLMAGLYLIGWIAPGYECVLCYVGETNKTEKNTLRAMYLVMGVAALFYGICPFIWQGVIGQEPLGKDLVHVLGPVYAPLLGGFANLGIAWLMIFNMIICIITPLAGPPRTLSQLARDGLIPRSFGLTTQREVPWFALLVTVIIALTVVWLGAPIWLIAATNFQYLLCISLASVAVLLLRFNAPNKIRPYRAPTVFVYLGFLSAVIWLVATILGFEQYGLVTMLVGILFAFIGLPLYAWRVIHDRIKEGLPAFPKTLHIRLTGTFAAVLVIDAIGYLISVHSLSGSRELVDALEDIFVVVALMTLTFGLVLPGMIVHMAKEVNNAAKRIININLAELSHSMKRLAAGDFDKVPIRGEIIPIKITTPDELGEMAHSFNVMQEEIKNSGLNFENVRNQLQNAITELKTLNTKLEDRVKERTKDLEESNEKLKNEISMRIKAEEKITTLNNEVVMAARRSGMAEIATSTLHNIGNILSSVNTSVCLVYEKLAHSEVNNLTKITGLLQQHQQDFETFILNDPKGKLIPNYLTSLSDVWIKQKEYLLAELNRLKQHIEHINDVIVMQQSLSGSLGMVEEVFIPEQIKSALELSKNARDRANINCVLELNSINKVIIDRVKLLQIIVNLIKNSVDALLESDTEQKQITIKLETKDEKFFKIQVSDNGIGIPSQNLSKIFSSGFTTKKNGHGFGLHSCANAATELGGKLSVESEGINKGATFTLVLPYQQTPKELK